MSVFRGSIIYSIVLCVGSSSQKSREITDLMHGALNWRVNLEFSVPLHLKRSDQIDERFGLTKYKWRAGFEHDKGFLPEEIKDVV